MNLKRNYHFYINTSAIQALTTAQVVGIQRSNLISIAPRLEFKNFEMAMPLTFQRDLYPQLGFAFRIENFVFGLDNVLPLILRNDTYGGGFYFNVGMKFLNKRCIVSRHRWDPRKTYAGYTFNSLKKKPKQTISLTKEGAAPERKSNPLERSKSLKKQGKQSKKKKKGNWFRSTEKL
jgi:hypothetical protein